jgi:hypothetical protein
MCGRLPVVKENLHVAPLVGAAMMEWTAPDGIISAKLVVLIRNQQRGPPMAKISMIGLDLSMLRGTLCCNAERWGAKGCGVGRWRSLSPNCRRRLWGWRRVVVRITGARMFQKIGHEARMMPPAYVKPYVKRNKNDGRDAEGVCEAMARPTMRFVPVKNLENQAVQVMPGTRRLLVRQRTMLANALRSALAEFGRATRVRCAWLTRSWIDFQR